MKLTRRLFCSSAPDFEARQRLGLLTVVGIAIGRVRDIVYIENAMQTA